MPFYDFQMKGVIEIFSPPKRGNTRDFTVGTKCVRNFRLEALRLSIGDDSQKLSTFLREASELTSYSIVMTGSSVLWIKKCIVSTVLGTWQFDGLSGYHYRTRSN